MGLKRRILVAMTIACAIASFAYWMGIVGGVCTSHMHREIVRIGDPRPTYVVSRVDCTTGRVIGIVEERKGNRRLMHRESAAAAAYDAERLRASQVPRQ